LADPSSDRIIGRENPSFKPWLKKEKLWWAWIWQRSFVAKKTQRTKVDPGDFSSFRAMAAQFLKAAGLARDHEYWNAAGLLIVHAAIAYADAVSIRLAGAKSTSDNHHDAVQLLGEAAAREKDRDRALGHLKRVIEEKSRVSYSGEAFRRAEIEALETHAERFCDWCEAVLGRSG
jgi:hypothetical protein